MTSVANSSMERRILSWGKPPKFIQHRTWPMPISRICSMWRVHRLGRAESDRLLHELFRRHLLEALGGRPEARLQSLYALRVAEQRAGKAIRALPKLKGWKGRHERPPAHA